MLEAVEKKKKNKNWHRREEPAGLNTRGGEVGPLNAG